MKFNSVVILFYVCSKKIESVVMNDKTGRQSVEDEVCYLDVEL